jgi:hypothetical protein
MQHLRARSGTRTSTPTTRFVEGRGGGSNAMPVSAEAQLVAATLGLVGCPPGCLPSQVNQCPHLPSSTPPVISSQEEAKARFQTIQRAYDRLMSSNEEERIEALTART